LTRPKGPNQARPIGNGQQITAKGYIISIDTDADEWDAAHDGYDTDADEWDDDYDTDADFDAPGRLPPAVLAQNRDALAAACASAAWTRRPINATPLRGPEAPAATADQASAKPATEAEPIGRNTPPATVWEALRRLLSCNRQELAARLGVSRHTLQRWERDEITETGAARVATLMQETLAAAGAGWTVAPPSRPTALKRGHRPARSPG
jgi:DNA-binding transcriptional regulator YiaG